VTSKTLYLRVVAENQLFAQGGNLYEDEAQFTRLQQLRTHAGQYLKAMSAQGLDDKFREVYRINEQLDQYPATQSAWLEQKALHLKEKERVAKQREQTRKEQELLIRKHRAEEEFRLYAANALDPEQIQYNELSVITDSAKTKSYAVICFYRRPKMSGRIVNSKLFMHNEFVFALATKKYKKICITPGVVKLNALHGTVKTSEKNLKSDVYTSSTLAFVTEAEHIYYIDVELVRATELTLTEPAVAEKYIAEYEEMD